jgi:hypothetical protein
MELINMPFFTTTRKMLTPLTNTTKTDTMTPVFSILPLFEDFVLYFPSILLFLE